MTDDRDKRRFSDPLHDTVDETSDAVVSGEINPDHTPVGDVVDRITQIVGELDDDARNRLAEAIGGHDHRGKVRAANRLMAAVAVDSRKVIAEVDRDLPEWVRHLEGRINEAEAEARAAKAAAKVCDDERIKREASDAKRAKWLSPVRNVGIGAILTALLWTVKVLNDRGIDSERARQRDAQVERNAHDIRDIQDRLIRAEVLLGTRIRFQPRPSDADRTEP